MLPPPPPPLFSHNHDYEAYFGRHVAFLSKGSSKTLSKGPELKDSDRLCKKTVACVWRMCYSITQIRESGSTEYLVAIQWKIQKSKPRSMTRPPNLKGQVVCCAIKICAGKKERPQAGGQSLVGAIMLCENLCGSRNAHKCEITYESTKYQVQKRRRQSVLTIKAGI